MQRGAIATVDIADPGKSWHCRGLLSRREIAICNSLFGRGLVPHPHGAQRSTGNSQAKPPSRGEREFVVLAWRQEPSGASARIARMADRRNSKPSSDGHVRLGFKIVG